MISESQLKQEIWSAVYLLLMAVLNENFLTRGIIQI